LHSALYGVEQGGAILVRFEKNLEIIHIRVGKKESRFRIHCQRSWASNGLI